MLKWELSNDLICFESVLLPKARGRTYFNGKGTSKIGRQRPNKSTSLSLTSCRQFWCASRLGFQPLKLLKVLVFPSQSNLPFLPQKCVVFMPNCTLNKFLSREKNCINFAWMHGFSIPNLRVIPDCTLAATQCVKPHWLTF